MTEFVHLHVHSHYSMLDGMSKVPDLVDKCVKNGMHAMALTDHGCMFGIKDLCDYVGKYNGGPKKKIGECKEEIEKTTDEAKLAELNATLTIAKEAGGLYEKFGEGVYVDVLGLCKVASREEIAAKG
ncbi:MAG: PHP domain-containing protein, partial [Bacteroidales bacterium]|nr:PHP domain-containing protein [Bacteroidales bacterium]